MCDYVRISKKVFFSNNGSSGHVMKSFCTRIIGTDWKSGFTPTRLTRTNSLKTIPLTPVFIAEYLNKSPPLKNRSMCDLSISYWNKKKKKKSRKCLIPGYVYRYVNHNAHSVSPGACIEAEGRIEMCSNSADRFVWRVKLIHWGLPV